MAILEGIRFSQKNVAVAEVNHSLSNGLAVAAWPLATSFTGVVLTSATALARKQTATIVTGKMLVSMARSVRKAPFVSLTNTPSEKQDKQRANRRFRR